MPRKGPAPRREIKPDPVYDSTLVTQLTNRVMIDGLVTTEGAGAIGVYVDYGAFEEVTAGTAGHVAGQFADRIAKTSCKADTSRVGWDVADMDVKAKDCFGDCGQECVGQAGVRILSWREVR